MSHASARLTAATLTPEALSLALGRLFGADSVLHAVSGGLDSMVLWHLLHRSGHPHTVAHVNYHLRGADSDDDEALVRRVATDRGVRLDVLSNSTLIGAADVQARARAIRFDYFAQVVQAQGHAATLLAHHRDDQLESLIVGLTRGGGPRALAGMRTLHQGRYRPLLDVPKSALRAYAKTHHVRYRDDRSNNADCYLRNRVRHHVLPALTSLEARTSEAAARGMRQQRQLLDFAEGQAWQLAHACADPAVPHALSTVRLRELDGLGFALHTWLRAHRFASGVVDDIADRIHSAAPARARFDNRARTHSVYVTGMRLWLARTGESEVSLPIAPERPS